MPNSFSLFDLLLLFGMTQGLITSVLLLRSNKNQPSNTFLALAIITFCILSSKMLFNTLGIYQIPYFQFFPIGIDYAIAPLLYFYVISIITPNFKLTKKDLLHAVPFIIFQLYAFFIYYKVVGITSVEGKDAIVNSYHYNPIKVIEDFLILFSIGGYVLVSFIKLKKYQQQLKDTISDNTFPDFAWLMRLFRLSSFVGVIVSINLILDFFFGFKNTAIVHWQVFYLYNAFLIYYLGFVGYQQPDFQIDGIEQIHNEAVTNNIESDKLDDIKRRLLIALDQNKVFLNPTLNAKDLAKKLSVSQANLSYVVNHSLNRNFRDLINEYRLKEFKQKLHQSDFSHLSLLSIALECGFNSEASFYRIFKKQTGLTPKEYTKNKTDV